MIYQIAYDISCNKTRRKVVEACKRTGLIRLQKSLFIGKCTDRLLKEFMDQVVPLLNPRLDSLCIQPLDSRDFNQLQLIGKAPEKKDILRDQPFVFI